MNVLNNKIRVSYLQLQKFQLHHLHLKRLLLNVLIRIGVESGAERNTVGVHATLLLSETLIGAIDCSSHGHDVGCAVMIVGVVVPGRHLKDLVLFLLRKRMGYSSRYVKGGSWSGSMRDCVRDRADSACAETREKRSSRVGGWCSSHVVRKKRREREWRAIKWES